MAPPKKLTFNFSSEAAPWNYIRGPAANRRRKQEKVVENAAVVVDDDDSPLFEPLASESPDQTEVSHRSRRPRPVSCTHHRVVRQATPEPTDANEAHMLWTNANVSETIPSCL